MGFLIFEDKLPKQDRTAIIAKVHKVAANLGIDPNWLMAVFNFESAGTFSPSIQNKYTKATGLIQFMPSTAIGLNTTIDELKKMDFSSQLDYVEKYYAPYKSKIKSFVDLYLATFFPIAIGKPDTWVLQARGIDPQKLASQNPIFDQGGFITVGKIKQVILSKVPVQYVAYVLKKNSGAIGTVLLALIIFGAYKLTKNKRK